MRSTNTVNSVERPQRIGNPVVWVKVTVTLRPPEEAVALLGSAVADWDFDESVNYLLSSIPEE
jgi:hypothetical protein